MSSDLKAGRALDAKVAELMGAVWQEFDATSGYYERGSVRGLFDLDSIIPGGRLLALVAADGSMRLFDGLPPYSTDIAAAWLVVEKMCALGWSPKIEYWNDAWHAWLWNEKEDPSFANEQSAKSDSAPHAICLAAFDALASHPPTQPTQENGT